MLLMKEPKFPMRPWAGLVRPAPVVDGGEAWSRADPAVGCCPDGRPPTAGSAWAMGPGSCSAWGAAAADSGDSVDSTGGGPPESSEPVGGMVVDGDSSSQTCVASSPVLLIWGSVGPIGSGLSSGCDGGTSLS